MIIKKQKLLYLIALLMAILIICIQLYYMGAYAEIPCNMKLVNCTNNVAFHLHAPKGRAYTFVLATTNTEIFAKPSFSFSGQVYIYDDTRMVIEFPIKSDFTKSSGNWLSNSQGLILTGNSNCPPLDQYIHAGKDYNFKIIFDNPPPSST